MRIISTLTFICLLTSCHNKEEQTHKGSFDPAAVQEHIYAMNKSYGDRFRHNDMEFYKERYCKDIIIMPEQLPSISGIDSVRIFNYNEGRNKDLNIAVTATKVYGGPDVVVEEGIYGFSDEKGISLDKGKFIAVWKQEEGKWKLFREIWNTDKAPGN